MKLLILLLFSIIPFLSYTQSEGRTVIFKNYNSHYYNAIEIDDDEIILFPGCFIDSCDDFTLDKIDKYGDLIETLTIEVPKEGSVYYLESTLPYRDNIIHCLLGNNRADSIFLLNVQIDLNTGETTLLDEVFFSPEPTSIVLNPSKQKEQGYIVAGYASNGLSSEDYIFITIQENGQIDDFQVIPQSESNFPILGAIRSLDVINPNRYLISGRRLQLSIIDSNYNQIKPIPFFEWNENIQEAIFAGPSSGIVLNDSTLLFDGSGRIFEDPTSYQDQILTKYTYDSQNDTVYFKKMVKVENPTGALIYPSLFGIMEEDANGDIFLSGFENLSVNSDFSGNSNHVYLAKYDVKLEKIWYKRFGGDFYHLSFNLTPLSNGNALIYGSVHDYFGDYRQQGFYILVDGKGDIVNSTHSVFPIKDISIYPNPSTNLIRFDLPKHNIKSIQIYNTLGVLVYQGKKENTIDISPLAQGHYFLRIQGTDNVYQTSFEKI